MQSDEDVGKVAQATPVVVAKALELFMIQLVDATCEKAREKNAKRISLVHLYNAVWDEERFDFLRDVMRNYEEQLNAEPKRLRGPKKTEKEHANTEAGGEDKPKPRVKKAKAAKVKHEEHAESAEHTDVKTEQEDDAGHSIKSEDTGSDRVKSEEESVDSEVKAEEDTDVMDARD